MSQSSKREIGRLETLKDTFGFVQSVGLVALPGGSGFAGKSTLDNATKRLFFHYSECTNAHPNDISEGDLAEYSAVPDRKNPSKFVAVQVRVLSKDEVALAKQKLKELADAAGPSSAGSPDTPSGPAPSSMAKYRGTIEKAAKLITSHSKSTPTYVPGRILCSLSPLARPSAPASASSSAASLPSSPTMQPHSQDARSGETISSSISLPSTPSHSPAPSPAEGAPATAADAAASADPAVIHVPYTTKDLVDPKTFLRAGDVVEFSLVNTTPSLSSSSSSASSSANKRAVSVRLVERVENRFQGRIVSLKESFGFIERSDVNEDIFFHYSELPSEIAPSSLHVDDEVDFVTHQRGGKLIAGKLRLLPRGTVRFETLAPARHQGLVTRSAIPLPRRQRQREEEFKTSRSSSATDPPTDATASSESGESSDEPASEPRASEGWEDVSGAQAARDAVYESQTNLAVGKIVFTNASGESEALAFTEIDVCNPFETIRAGDTVEFSVAVFNRIGKRRATNLVLVQSCKNDATREQGVISTLKEGYGFIKCADRDLRLYFHFSELPYNHTPRLGDEVEFNLFQEDKDKDSADKLSATHISVLPHNTVKFDVVEESKLTGTVESSPASSAGSSGGHRSGKASETGVIKYQKPGASADGDESQTATTIEFHVRDLADIRSAPVAGDVVDFNISRQKRNGATKAVNLVVVKRAGESTEQGIVSSLKDNFGFIELADHSRDVYFHLSELLGDKDAQLRVGDEVEFLLVKRSTKWHALNVRILPKGSLGKEEPSAETYVGIVSKTLSPAEQSSDQAAATSSSSCGTITYAKDAAEIEIPYSFSTLQHRKPPSKNTLVQFNVGVNRATKQPIALNVSRLPLLIGVVDSIQNHECSISPASIVSSTASALGAEQAGTSSSASEPEEAATSKTQYANAMPQVAFPLSDVKDDLRFVAGTEIEFALAYNAATKKFAATKVRPLKFSLKKTEEERRVAPPPEERKVMMTIRAPKGPDGSPGFAFLRPSAAASSPVAPESSHSPVVAAEKARSSSPFVLNPNSPEFSFQV